MQWSTNFPGRDAHQAKTLAAVMQAVHECASPMAQRTFATFDRYDGLDEVMVNSLEKAAKAGFGLHYKGVSYYEKAPVNVLPHISDRRGEDVSLHLSFRAGYKWIDMQNASNANKVFRAIADSLRAQITEFYPDAEVCLQHSGCYKQEYSLHLTVNVRPEMPLAQAA